MNRDKEFTKRYLNVLVDEVVISGCEASIKSVHGPKETEVRL